MRHPFPKTLIEMKRFSTQKFRKSNFSCQIAIITKYTKEITTPKRSTPKGEFAEEEEEEGIEFSVDNYMKNLRVNCEEDFVSNDEDDGETEYDEEDIEEIKHEELPSDISDKKKISSSSIMKSKIKGIFTK